MIDEMIKSVAPDLQEGEFTMVVSNYLSKSGVRPRSPAAKKAMQLVIGFLDNPTRAAKKHPAARNLARVLQDQAKQFEGMHAEFVKGGGRRVVASINDEFVKMMGVVARGSPPTLVSRQGLQVLSPVLRVGRLHVDSKRDQARVVLDDEEVEVPLEDDAIEAAHNAAKGRELHLVDIDAVYDHTSDGRVVFNAHKSQITAIGRRVRPMSGAAMLSLLHEKAPSLRDANISDLLKSD